MKKERMKNCTPADYIISAPAWSAVVPGRSAADKADPRRQLRGAGAIARAEPPGSASGRGAIGRDAVLTLYPPPASWGGRHRPRGAPWLRL